MVLEDKYFHEIIDKNGGGGMRIGKIPEVVLKRSVFKIIRHRRKEVLVRPGVGLDCAHVEIGNDEVMVLSTDPITGTEENIGTLAVHVTANDIASSGAEPIGIMVSTLLPEYTDECKLKEIMRELEAACEELNIEVMGGHTEITDVVNKPLLTITGVGKIKKVKMYAEKKIRPGTEIIMTKWAGLEGTAIIAKEKREELTTRYTSDFVDSATNLLNNISIVKEAKIASEHGAYLMHDITEGGVFGALWEIACAGRCGIEVDLKKIPIRQETVEISEFYDINPYMLISSGSLLIFADHANALVDELQREGISAVVIGKATEDTKKIVYNEDEMRFLEPASVDELYKVLKA